MILYGCNIRKVYFSESFRSMGKLWLVLLLPPPGCLFLGDTMASVTTPTTTTTTQNKRPVVFHTVSFATINFHFTLVCCFLFPFAGLVVGFGLFALRSGRNLFSIADACSGEVWMSLVHNLEPKRRVAALRFPSFLMQNFALCLPKDNFPSIMFLNLNRFPLWRRCVLFTKCFVWLWVSFCFC